MSPLERQKMIVRDATRQRGALSNILLSKRDKYQLKEYYTARIKAAQAIIDTHNAREIRVNAPVTL